MGGLAVCCTYCGCVPEASSTFLKSTHRLRRVRACGYVASTDNWRVKVAERSAKAPPGQRSPTVERPVPPQSHGQTSSAPDHTGTMSRDVHENGNSLQRKRRPQKSIHSSRLEVQVPGPARPTNHRTHRRENKRRLISAKQKTLFYLAEVVLNFRRRQLLKLQVV